MFKRLTFVLLSLLILGGIDAAMAGDDPSLTGWWKFDETSGTTAMDSSGNGTDIALENTTWEDGFFGGAVHFHGAGFGRDTAFTHSDNAITVCAWVWHDAFAAGVERYVTVGGEVAVIRRNGDGRLHFYCMTGGEFWHLFVGDVLAEGQWHHVAGTWDGATQRLYLDGVEIASQARNGVLGNGTMVRLSSPDGEFLNGMLDDTRIYNRALSADEIKMLMDSDAIFRAANPVPTDRSSDVPRDVILGWTPGRSADKHDVYFGDNLSDVNDASRSNSMGVLVSEGQAATTCVPGGVLDFETTYYWRLDEVNGAPDNTIFKGDIWSFTTEPFVYPIEGVVASTNGIAQGGALIENTVNGSGLDESDQHSIEATDMWLGVAGADPLYLQYEFDGIYKLHEMLVWNYNVQFELVLGFGIKDVTVEYSTDGAEWTILGDVALNQATAMPDCTANTTIDFGGAAAKFVRLMVNSGQGPMGQFGLSEVRFMFIPAVAREPEPADTAADVSVNAALAWRAGRDSVSHDVYFGTAAEALALAGTVDAASYGPGTLDLNTTYFWQIDEIQDAESWAGPVWSFTTQAYLVVEDFESYDDEDNRIYQTWVDGYGVNSNGSQVGNLESPFAEQTIVKSGSQSMPLFYDNSGASMSEAELTLTQNWTASGVKGLTLSFQGAADNTGGQLYVKINGTEVLYDGAAVNLGQPGWNLWSIDLAAVGNVSNVTSLIIGVEGAGAKGVVYIDDVRLSPEVLAYHKEPDVTAAGDVVQGVPNDDDWPDGETPDLAADDDVNTKFLHRKGGAMATGIQITPAVGPTVVTGLTLTTANDAPTRDPIAFELSGSNAGIDGPYTLIASGDIVDFAGQADWPRFAKNETLIAFDNDVAYAHYQIVFPTLRGENEALMQIAEIELIGQ